MSIPLALALLAQISVYGGEGAGAWAGNTTRYVFSYGDSRVAQVGWQRVLETRSGSVAVDNVGIGGATAASLAARVAADLADAKRYSNTEAALVNVGANDTSLAADPATHEATWEANLGAILDAIHAKWPAARVYVMRPWARGAGVLADTIAAWIAVVLASRPWAANGPDERVWLAGVDDGALMTMDGVHYSFPDGHDECAAQWKTVLGY